MSVFRRDKGSFQTSTIPSPSIKASRTYPESSAPEPQPAEAEIETAQAEAAVEQPAAQAPLDRAAAAVIDTQSEIKGTLHSKGNVLIEGCFEGEIEAKETVWVEKGSTTQAQLRANDVTVSGLFDGQIDCQHRLQITATATISGEIKTPVLVIEEGATVNCRFSMPRPGRKTA